MVPEPIHDSIVSFLVSSASKKPIVRCSCGAAMQPRYVTFFYDGKSWEVSLELCLKCHPDPVIQHNA
jgi:hypothetical protein